MRDHNQGDISSRINADRLNQTKSSNNLAAWHFRKNTTGSGFKRSTSISQMNSFKPPQNNQSQTKIAKLDEEKIQYRKTFFQEIKGFDPIYYPNANFLKTRVDSLCLKFNRTTKRSDHNFLGIPKETGRKKIIPSLLMDQNKNKISQK